MEKKSVSFKEKNKTCALYKVYVKKKCCSSNIVYFISRYNKNYIFYWAIIFYVNTILIAFLWLFKKKNV